MIFNFSKLLFIPYSFAVLKRQFEGLFAPASLTGPVLRTKITIEEFYFLLLSQGNQEKRGQVKPSPCK
jgi:hypothetical protein